MSSNSLIRMVFVVAMTLVTGRTTVSRAGDWPQILGPDRNGAARGESLPEAWPAVGPKQRWSQPIGEGYAGPAVAGSRVIVFHRTKDGERVDAFDAKSGKSLWGTDFPANYRGGIDPDRGPRCVPVIQKDRVIVFGAAGDLRCLNLSDGRELWSRAAYADFQGDEGYFGAGSSPLVVEDRVLVNVGGAKGAGIVAFSLATGQTLWKSFTDDASYSSPTLATLGDKPAAIFVTRLNCVAVSPESGEVRFQFPFGKRGPTVNAATPIIADGQLVLTASYGIGARVAPLASATKPLWENDDSLSSQYSTPVYHAGHLYGIHGREDVGGAELRCVDPRTGKVAWSESGFGVANLILAGDKLLIVKTDGTVVLAQANPRSFRKLGQAQITNATTRALPALAAGNLYLRTNEGRGGGGKLLCADVTTGK